MCSAPLIFGCSGKLLSNEEYEFFKSVKPYGFILFDRNISDPHQVRCLSQTLREAVGSPAAPIFIDQEGGRVARLRPPHWRTTPSAKSLVEKFCNDPELICRLVRLNSRLIAHDLINSGISVSCMPVLDLVSQGAHEVIGDRAYGSDPEKVSLYGGAACQGLLEGGVLPVIKHIPGHGRATLDSHLALPRIDAGIEELERTDFSPFRELRQMPMAMTAHVLFSAVDPVRPATMSCNVVSHIIRRLIGFDGLLITDDISMGALTGTLSQRARGALSAGCDLVLHCNGILAEMKEVAMSIDPMSDITRDRVRRCQSLPSTKPSAIDFAEDLRELDELLAR